jgi:exopolysaccharide production protein ExoY
MREATIHPAALALPVPAFDPSSRLASRAAKRALDCLIAAVLLIALLPFLLIVAGLIATEGRGRILFGHGRIGRGGRPFRCLKFRTMFVDAEARLQALLASNPARAAEWAIHRKLDADPRITPVGRFLRATSLDELPQLINVLRGEMSIVGPRPVTAEELLRYGSSARAYKSVRPGITGPWQVSGRNRIGYADRVRLDAGYARDWTVRSDIMLVLRTPSAVLSQRGAG